jgi:hypothetical protein
MAAQASRQASMAASRSAQASRSSA